MKPDADSAAPSPMPAQSDAVLRVESISKVFGETVAVRDLSFEAHAGEVIGLLGPNGAGKTSAMRVLSTIYPPDRGRFSLAGEPHTDPRAIRRQIGLLPESAGYPLQQSGTEFVEYYARLFGHSARRAREIASVLLELVGLGDRATKLIGTYSRGMRQRLGVARALVNAPRVMFLDEPTLGLDPAGQRQILALIKDVAREQGSTVILSTHFLDEVEEVCSRAIILNRGVVIAEGRIADIMRRAAPSTAAVRVPDQRRDEALALLARVNVVTDAASGAEPGSLRVRFDGAGESSERASQSVLRALIDADIPLIEFSLEGGRLSDAFLQLTGEKVE